ncbi:pre-RNA processing PIH1/Nop17-domain-containing protein [Desarmillaria tabescens]|uniref:Pre-RNA processing PIH1/Nop17-domain-containing protein n=1 Tax=Armillaria tabescens TaxID=1929756 RepID=A0AA39T439_ARMTA|nr:pre-RNA processing PIH1/Nop17-domain-containing protein [Desarmillaria tabescens]KAK0463181.1 pre-RNA processing PIH1/Nop17-domain-containing protein [Desarmillaria tabescens]
MISPSTTKRVTLSPQAGFCVKSTTIAENGGNGMKVFINIAWDANVPSPPPASDEVIQRAMQGEDDDGWYVPVVVSEPRGDVDKVGKPSLVIDCVYNKSLKSRVLRDPAWKTFLIELALQRIEVQSGLLLSRRIGTPNIASKGKLGPREVTVPDLSTKGKEKETKKALIEEVSTGSWAWSRSSQSDCIDIRIAVPNLDRSLIGDTSLDLEPRRLILSVPSQPTLDIDLSISDAELASKHSLSDAIALKRQRPFKVDEATAEWIVSEKVLVLHA